MATIAVNKLINGIVTSVSPKQSEEVELTYYHIQMTKVLEHRKYEEEMREKYHIEKKPKCSFDFD